MSLLPSNYDEIFRAPVLIEPTDTECHACHEEITDFDCSVTLNIGRGLSTEFHALCGANEWAEALDLEIGQ